MRETKPKIYLWRKKGAIPLPWARGGRVAKAASQGRAGGVDLGKMSPQPRHRNQEMWGVFGPQWVTSLGRILQRMLGLRVGRRAEAKVGRPWMSPWGSGWISEAAARHRSFWVFLQRKHLPIGEDRLLAGIMEIRGFFYVQWAEMLIIIDFLFLNDYPVRPLIGTIRAFTLFCAFHGTTKLQWR